MSSDFEERLRKQIRYHEGVKLKLYKCPAGKLTIGYGRNIEDNGISLACAKYMLEEDIEEAKKNLYFVFGENFFNSLSDNQRIALIDMMFNLGLNRFMTFKKAIRAIKNRDFETASDEIEDSKAYNQNPNRYNLIASEIRK